jgi:tetratricopeptide (TPR) repeat protein
LANLQNSLKKGFLLQQEGKIPEAKRIYQQALKKAPTDINALQLLGLIELEDGQFESAIELFNQALLSNSEIDHIHLNLANAYLHLKKYDQAITHYLKSIQLNPKVSKPYYGLGLCYNQLGQWDLAIQNYIYSIQLEPDSFKAYLNLGTCLEESRMYPAAIESYDKAIAIKPDYARAYNNRGNALRELNRLDEALASYDQALEIEKGYAQVYNNRGTTLKDLKRFDEAILSYKESIAIDPNYQSPHWNLSLCQLLMGNFAEGWAGYENRWKYENSKLRKYKKEVSQPLWLGEQTLHNQTILLYAEQGFGDTIQFSRYIPMVHQLGARVILEVQTPLLGLFQHLENVCQLIPQGTEIQEFDYQCPLMSLPLAFKTDLETIPAPQGCIQVPQVKLQQWGNALKAKTKPRVGIVWSGSSSHLNDIHRSLSLEQLIPYLPQNAQYFSLQRELRESDQRTLANHPEITHFGALLEDFSDTAALCELMDIVISVDTSVAHLAGTIGKPTWVLLPYTPDWRWLLDREDSPWYPSMRLFRQKNLGDWDSALQPLQGALETLNVP